MNIFKKFKFRKYKTIVIYNGVEYSQCEETKKRRVRVFHRVINDNGEPIREYYRPFPGGCVDFDFMEGKSDYPKSPEELNRFFHPMKTKYSLIIDNKIFLDISKYNEKISMELERLMIGDLITGIEDAPILSGPYKVKNKIWDFSNNEKELKLSLEKI